MGVRKVKGSWWVDFQIRLKRYRYRSPESTREGALAYEAVLRQRLARGEPPEPLKPSEGAVLSFREFAERWFRIYSVNNKPSEQRNKRSFLNVHLIPWFGEMELSLIGQEDIEEFKSAKMKQGLEAKTINNILCVLFRCLRSAVEWGVLDRLPILKLLKVKPSRFDFLGFDEAERLVAACEDSMWRQMVLLALRTGMRVGELFGLEWQDIDFARKQLTVNRSIVYGVVGTPKSNKSRHIPLTNDIYQSLYGSRKLSGLVFHREDGTALSHRIAERALHRACKRTGLRKIGWHVLRHTFASHLATEGVPMRTVQELLGHSTVLMTMRYAHLTSSALQDAVAVLERRTVKASELKKCQPAVNLKSYLAKQYDGWSSKKQLSINKNIFSRRCFLWSG